MCGRWNSSANAQRTDSLTRDSPSCRRDRKNLNVYAGAEVRKFEAPKESQIVTGASSPLCGRAES